MEEWERRRENGKERKEKEKGDCFSKGWIKMVVKISMESFLNTKCFLCVLSLIIEVHLQSIAPT